jgi:hypothetical protein
VAQQQLGAISSRLAKMSHPPATGPQPRFPERNSARRRAIRGLSGRNVVEATERRGVEQPSAFADFDVSRQVPSKKLQIFTFLL